ncbi:adenine phosphoribosyltransferase [Corynebacterium bovis]|uniref:adenine phosphoribosyltransferase n=1 Tax=Corynebacterium bovis TaxID=36808 RepID=UPI00313A4073
MTETRFSTATEALTALTRVVPDFPSPGVTFADLTPVLADPDGFRVVVDDLAAAVGECAPDLVAGLDARGFLVGSAVARALGTGILAVRKAGKLPPPVHHEEYALEYGTAALQIPASGVPLEGRRIVLVDDVLATGGTMAASRAVLERAGAVVCGLAVVLEVPGLGGRDRFPDLPLSVAGDRDDDRPGADGATAVRDTTLTRSEGSDL